VNRRYKNMAEQVRVVVDAMGGDNAPAEPVRAAVEAVTERQDIKVILTGKQEVIDKELAKYSGYPDPGCQCIPGDRDSRTPCFCDP
jgi:glycerol-3-phosphate acyltransferase PlsX